MKEKQTMKSIFEYEIQVLITNNTIKRNLQQTTDNCVSLLSNTIKIQPERGSELETIELM